MAQKRQAPVSTNGNLSPRYPPTQRFDIFLRFLAFSLAFALPAHGDVWSFATPSNYIECWVGESLEGSDIECTVFQKGGTPPAPRPAGCTQNWGHVFLMDKRGYVSMTYKTVAGPGNGAQSVAEYGVSGRIGSFTRRSERTGLECWNLDGHGFFLSRAVQRVF